MVCKHFAFRLKSQESADEVRGRIIAVPQQTIFVEGTTRIWQIYVPSDSGK
jgi:hypothetical protein